MALTLDPKQWQKGFVAGQRNEVPAEGSNAVGTVEGWSWSSGYIEGKATGPKPAIRADAAPKLSIAVPTA